MYADDADWKEVQGQRNVTLAAFVRTSGRMKRRPYSNHSEHVDGEEYFSEEQHLWMSFDK